MLHGVAIRHINGNRHNIGYRHFLKQNHAIRIGFSGGNGVAAIVWVGLVLRIGNGLGIGFNFMAHIGGILYRDLLSQLLIFLYREDANGHVLHRGTIVIHHGKL